MMAPNQLPNWGSSRDDDSGKGASPANAKKPPVRPPTGQGPPPKTPATRPGPPSSPGLPPAKPTPNSPPVSPPGASPVSPPGRPLRPRTSPSTPGSPAAPAGNKGTAKGALPPPKDKGTLASPSAGKPGSLPGWRQAASAARQSGSAKSNATSAAKAAAKQAAVKSATTAASSATGIPQPIIERALRHWRGILIATLIVPSLFLFFIIVISIGTFTDTNSNSAAASCISASDAATAATAATSGPTPDPNQLALFMAAERWQESHDNYTEPGSGAVWDPNYNGVATLSSYNGAFGAYQFEQPTWYSNASAAGYPEYKNVDPTKVAPAVQDAVAAYYYTSHYRYMLSKGYPGNIWLYVAEMTLDPSYANPQSQDLPVPNNGTLTDAKYGNGVISNMSSEPWLTSTTTTTIPTGLSSSTTTTTAVLAAYSGQCNATQVSGPLANRIVQIATAQLGKTQSDGAAAYGPSAWGPAGEAWCAFFATWVLAQAGVQPTVPSLGYSGEPWNWIGKNGGMQLAPTATPQPGDLIFFGTGYANYGSHHVAIITQVLPGGKLIIIGGNSGDASNTTSTVQQSKPFNPPLTLAEANAGGWPGQVWAYAQPPGV